MKKSFLFMLVFCTSVYTMSFAQSASAPEVPRNYKPKSKDLLPMPGELTEEMIFPALGTYEYTDDVGSIVRIIIARDTENKGTVWINGMPQGKFKADLKMSPSTYKIPEQKTLQNDSVYNVPEETDDESISEENKKPEKNARFSGKSLKEGTLIFDSTTNKLYVNIGGKFNQETPAAIFPEMMEAVDTTFAETEEESAATKKKSEKKKKSALKGNTYILTKVIEDATTIEPTEEESGE